MYNFSMEFIAVEKVQKIIDHVYKTDDLKLIASYINELKHELKRDELFVLEIFSQLSDESVYNLSLIHISEPTRRM